MEKLKVAVGSTNPVKIEAVREVFQRAFGRVKAFGVEVDSRVSAQPFQAGEIVRGAVNRARQAMRARGADYGVGIEGGVTKFGKKWYNLGFVAVVDKKGKVGTGASGWFECPEKILRELKKGKELGEIMDRLTGRRDTKKHEGAIGIFTRGKVDRKALYEHGVWMALGVFLSTRLLETGRDHQSFKTKLKLGIDDTKEELKKEDAEVG